MEHVVCKGCPYNKYPLCYGIIMMSGKYMLIDNLKEGFECGQKDEPILTDLSIVKKSALELRIEELEAKLSELEKKI